MYSICKNNLYILNIILNNKYINIIYNTFYMYFFSSSLTTNLRVFFLFIKIFSFAK